MPPIRVLIFPAGEFNSAELCLALSRQLNVELYGASSVERLGHHMFMRYRNDLPMINDTVFLESFNAMLLDWRIDLVVLTHDTVVKYFSDNRGDVLTQVLLPDRETADACRDKSLAMEILAGEPFIPRVYTSPGTLPPARVFVKPKRGQGAVGARIVEPDSSSVQDIDWDNEIVCDYLPGEELTVDCFTDRHGTLQGIFPRTRDRVLGGITVSGRTRDADGEILSIAGSINNRLKFLGQWFLQIKKAEDGRWKLLEISARCSGTQCLTRARGVNLPLLSVYAAMGHDVTVFENGVPMGMDRILVPLFDFPYDYRTVYLDYDDTLVHPWGVDPEIISLAYQWRNDGVEVVLITRHAGDLAEHMMRHNIPSGLFSKIIHLHDRFMGKYSCIEATRSIFIDNAFAERLEVHRMHGIPVFDVEGVQVLRKWKR